MHDPKVAVQPGEKYRLYVSHLENRDTIQSIVSNANQIDGEMDSIEILQLSSATKKPEDGKHGALYLPYPYVVPGGVFQEMYA